MNEPIDMTGGRYERLTVIERAPNTPGGLVAWRCKCDCGQETVVLGSSLRSDKTKSCGCLSQWKKQQGFAPGDEVACFTVVRKLGAATYSNPPGLKGKSEQIFLVKCRDCQGFACVTPSLVIADAPNDIGGKKCACAIKGMNSRYRPNMPGEAGLRNLYSRYQYDANRRGLSFQLDFFTFANLVTQNCHYCGAAPKNKIQAEKQGSIPFTYNGIDRVNNLNGYEYMNCVTSCEFCNRAKGTRSYESFVNWLQRVAAFQNSPNV